ncbi:MAG TPA: hypothetical protein VKV19_02580 [Ktedonobacteraceae bacterium]|nr:hypothetical protein [Ktedonobacteraceae bacterium]
MLSEELAARLAAHGIAASDETSLRETLEERIETYTLFKLAPWPARRWKCHYRLMTRDRMYDGQSVEDVYALALLGNLEQS